MMTDKLNSKYTIPITQFGGFVMATDAQVAANRINAQKSTGPRTAEGKAVVAQNALKHGLLAREAVIRGEDPGEFEFYRDRMLGELAPVGTVESVLAERAVGLSWRLRRAERVQNEVFDTLYSDQMDNPLAKLTQSMLPKHLARPQVSEDGRDLTLARVVVKDSANSRVLDRLLMYERRIEHSLFRTMRELQQLRLLRELEAPTRSGEEDASGRSRLPRRSAPRNDRAAREEGSAKRGQFEGSSLLRRFPLRNGGRGRGGECAKQSQFARAGTTAKSVSERELGGKCENDVCAKTKPISERGRPNETANAGAIAM
jgi:hypothetical protein